MARIHEQAGSTTKIIAALQGTQYQISSLADIAEFEKHYQENYDALKEKAKVDLANSIVSLESQIAEQTQTYTQHIADKKIELSEELERLKKELPELQKKQENFFKDLIQKVRYYFASTRKTYLDDNISNEAKRIFRQTELTIADLGRELEDKKNNTESWVEKMTLEYTAQLQWVQKTIQQNTLLLRDAESEEKAIQVLSILPDDVVVINDYSRKFFKPLHNKEANEWVSSMCIDHIVIGPTGLYVIETKYWDGDHMGEADVTASVQQIVDATFVMKTVLNQVAYQGDLPPFRINGVPVPITPNPMVLLVENTNSMPASRGVQIVSLGTIVEQIKNNPVVYAADAIACLETFLLNKDNVTGYQSM